MRKEKNTSMNNVYCENCDKETDYYVQQENKTVVVKGKQLNVTIYVAFCSICHEKVFPDKVAKQNDLIIYDEYRRIEGLLTSDEIKAIRHKRGMSQTDLADFIQCGHKNIARYENGTIQDKVFDLLIRMVGDDACFNAIKSFKDNLLNKRI